MDESRIKMLRYLFGVINLILIGTLFLALTGILGSSILGLNLADFIFIITDIFMLIVVVYTYFSIQLNKKKHGKPIFTMKRLNNKPQIMGIILLIFLLIFQLFLNFIVLEYSLSLKTTVMTFFLGMLILMAIFRNTQKEGLSDKGVYYLGESIEWNIITCYSVTEDKLILFLSQKTLKENKNVSICFKIENNDKESIEYFLLNKSIRKCCE